MIDKEFKTSDECCQNCTPYLGDDRCLAFDSIPRDVFLPLRPHNSIMKGQKGTYVFEPREVNVMRAYVE